VDKLYFPLVLCFRGRVYANSLISYTSTVALRNLNFYNNPSKTVEFDATSNMLQVISTIIGSHKMMINSNVIMEIDSEPKDPYSFFKPKEEYTKSELEYMLEEIKYYLADQNIVSKKPRIITIESFKDTLPYIDRNLIKNTLMT
jgi:hypothetical protein